MVIRNSQNYLNGYNGGDPTAKNVSTRQSGICPYQNTTNLEESIENSTRLSRLRTKKVMQRIVSRESFSPLQTTMVLIKINRCLLSEA